jgi:DDE_Tnp_1-associated
MNYSTLVAAMEPVAGEQQIEAWSVYRAFEQIQDGRRKRGVRYSVPLILTLIVLAKLAGMTTLAGIAEWVRLRAQWLNQVLPHPQESFPCAATYSNVLRTLEAEQVRQGHERLADPSGSHERR